ncbi:hypothetical protein [Micromonospora sp. NPDC006431]|uniref:hypothetical protein n=1 Tax=Micromonospora sp. NPDC006431 TaxID=3364235 RepID=UPI0036A324FB
MIIPWLGAGFADSRSRRRLLRRALTVVMALCWLAWAALAWWTSPRQVGPEQLDRDLAAGRIVTFVRADGWDQEGGFWGRRPEPRYDSEGWMMIWSLPDGRVRYADVGVLSIDEERSADHEDARLAQVASSWRADGAPADRLADAAGLLAGALALTWLGLLVAGPAPQAGSRWFWFWLGLLPFGAGLLGWLLREQWHAELPAGRDRQSGWAGFGWALLGGLVLSLAVLGLRALFGGIVIPGG